MPLLSLWDSNPAAITALNIEQIVATAGDGKLRDDSECSREVRTYLAQVSSDDLSRYAVRCLEVPFDKSGHVLQDIVNELGRRLDYTVVNGRYQGTTNDIGNDGIWTSPEGHEIVIEVKTTDAYRIALNTIADYRLRLRSAGRIGEQASILLVVGRQDTGELEAQVRGSRHAWDVRLISVDSLVSLVKLKESTEAGVAGRKIRGILIPMEFTRLDSLVDVMFTAAKEVESAKEAESVVGADSEDASADIGANKPRSAMEFTDSASLNAKRESILAALGRRDGKRYIKRSSALYWDPSHEHRVACTLSKRYTRRGSPPYWYAYHPGWDQFLCEAATGNLILGCMDLNVAFVLPVDVVRTHLVELTTTVRSETDMYWHLKILEPRPSRFSLQLPKTGRQLDLGPFTLTLE